ncbi:hypothetical protein F889_02614 [Acinetobacter colistiniresistens]|uniref:BppU N-terminal domain-containing protein n=1 Tax=Acinetobacter colistiniresistens TaxID=280145 RepID=N9R5R0_9GAMM|nr:hypothetical protein [Acinetobacter colistiniresistens]ENX33950.1 hypothetical protein F889_02614 [Acinetobacter colistiniresistens]
MNLTIKTGNDFALLFIVRDADTREPLTLTDNMLFTAKIADASGKEIAVCDVTICDQTAIKGGVLLEVDKSITADWKVGKARTDVRLEIDGTVKNSNTISFTIEKSIS